MQMGMGRQGKADKEKKAEKDPLNLSNVWSEARVLVGAHKRRLAWGALLLMVSRACAFVLPWEAGTAIEAIEAGQGDRLKIIALFVGLATLVQAITIQQQKSRPSGRLFCC